jgi:hypothetical protein
MANHTASDSSHPLSQSDQRMNVIRVSTNVAPKGIAEYFVDYRRTKKVAQADFVLRSRSIQNASIGIRLVYIPSNSTKRSSG